MGEASECKFGEDIEDLLDHLASPEFALGRRVAEPVAEVAVRIVFHGNIGQVALGILVPTEHANDGDRVRDLPFSTNQYVHQSHSA